MIPNSKLFPKLTYFLLLTLVGCNGGDLVPPPPPPKQLIKNKLFVVVDQSESVSYHDKEMQVQRVLDEAFNKTYKHVIEPTEYLLSSITTETNVVPTPYAFKATYPNHEELGEIDYQDEMTKWLLDQKKWKREGIERINNSILAGKKGSTDVYSIFQAIEMKIADLKKQDTLKIILFSDMKQSTRGYELTNLLAKKNINEFAKSEFSRICNEKQVNKINDRFHCDVTVVTPDQFKNSSQVVQYWNTFFKEWGLEGNIDWQ